MQIKDEKTVKLVNSICIGQFVVILLYVMIFCNPRTQLHMALVGLSAACGLLLSGIIRREYVERSSKEKTKKTYQELDETLNKIRQQK